MSTAIWCRCALLAAVICLPVAARAEEADSARSLFEQGRKLLEQNRTAEACTLFARSQELEPTVAALLNLGLCERQRGRLATALDYFRRAARASDEEGDRERAAKAVGDAEEVARLAGTLSIRAAPRTGDDIECLVDGIVVPRSDWPKPTPLDSGAHRVEVRRRQRVLSTTVVVISDGHATVYEIPEVDDDTSRISRAPSSPRKAAPRAGAVTNPPEPRHHVPMASYVAGGVGIASLAVALGFGAVAWAKYAEAEAQCAPDHRCSSGTPLSLYDSAVDNARVANIAAAVGGVSLAAGVVFYFVQGRDREDAMPVRVSASWGLGAGGVTLRGAF